MTSTRVAATIAIGASWMLLGAVAVPRAQSPGLSASSKQAPATARKKLPPGAVTQMPASPPTLAAPQSDPNQTPSRVTITQDGSIEQRQADGSIRRSRPGVCGWTIISPDGKPTQFVCSTQVQKLAPPAPSGDTAVWLEAHADSLLEIARSLLGPNATTIDNHVSKNEAELVSVYDRIRVRTDLVSGLSAVVAGR